MRDFVHRTAALNQGAIFGQSQMQNKSPEKIRRCFRCQSTQHLARNCHQVNEIAVDNGQTDEARVNACFGDIKTLDSNFVGCNSEMTVTNESVDMCASDRDDASTSDKANDWEFSDYPRVDAVVTKCGESPVYEIKLSALKFIDVIVNGVHCVSLVDSGAEISLLSQQLVSRLGIETCGRIKVKGIFSDPIQVPLVNVNVTQYGNENDVTQLTCAVVPLSDVSHDVVLPLDVVACLEHSPVMNVSVSGDVTVEVNPIVVPGKPTDDMAVNEVTCDDSGLVAGNSISIDVKECDDLVRPTVVCDINRYNRGGNEVVTKCMYDSFITKLLITALLLGQAVCHTLLDQFSKMEVPSAKVISATAHNFLNMDLVPDLLWRVLCGLMFITVCQTIQLRYGWGAVLSDLQSVCSNRVDEIDSTVRQSLYK